MTTALDAITRSLAEIQDQLLALDAGPSGVSHKQSPHLSGPRRISPMRLRCAFWPDDADNSEIRGGYFHDAPLEVFQ
ncbi:MAG: hypothetical protein O6853_07015, partial [Actinobacteria bacterium]|nr:hypothetical protein [Actinomycetota bacterium]